MARASTSDSCTLTAPRSGSKRFLLTMASVPTKGGVAGAAGCGGGLEIAARGFTGAGKSQGPCRQTDSAFAPSPTAQTTSRILKSAALVRILNPLGLAMRQKVYSLLSHTHRKSLFKQ